jgi:hypothetical protein
MVDFFTSTKFPILAFAPISEPGRKCAKGPTTAPAAISLSSITEQSFIVTLSAITLLMILDPGQTTLAAPILVLPSILMLG